MIVLWELDHRISTFEMMEEERGRFGNLKQSHVLKLHPDDPHAFFALLRRFAARDHQFAGAEYEYYYLGLLDPVDQPRKLLRLVLYVLEA